MSKEGGPNGSPPPSPRMVAMTFQMQALTRHLERLLQRQSDEIHERIDKLERDRASYHDEESHDSERQRRDGRRQEGRRRHERRDRENRRGEGLEV